MPDRDNERLRRELGVTRRDMLRRGALAGGALLWSAPLIQSVGPSALAGTPRKHKCCFCSNHRRRNFNPPTQCINNGVPPDAAECAAVCESLGYRTSSFCQSGSPTTCSAAGCVCN